MIILNANLAYGAGSVSPVVMVKLIGNSKTVTVTYGDASPAFDALATVLEASGIAENEYWYEKMQVCHWLLGAGKTGEGGIQVQALILVGGARSRKRYVQCFQMARPCIPLDISLLLIADPTIHRLGSPQT